MQCVERLMSRRRGTQAASGLGRDNDKTVRGTKTVRHKMHTQMAETATYGDKREIVRGCCRKIVRGTPMNAGGSLMNVGGARHGRCRQEHGIEPKLQRHKCQACTRVEAQANAHLVKATSDGRFAERTP